VQLSFLAEELVVEQEDEKIDVDLCSVKHPHHCHAFILQLQQVLSQTHITSIITQAL